MNSMKSLCGKILLIIGIVAGLTGCGSKDSSYACTPVDASYQLKQIYILDGQKGWALSSQNELLFTEDGVENFVLVKDIAEEAGGKDASVGIFPEDESTVHVAYIAPDRQAIVVESTFDAGTNWSQTVAGETDDALYEDDGTLFLNFQDAENGYLLYCGTPAAGLMEKKLFRTQDGGKTFALRKDLTGEIDGYPQGIEFSGTGGYLAVTYHGNAAYLYQTTDAGQTWKSIHIFTPDQDVAYIDAYAPVFCYKEKAQGALIVRETGKDAVYKLFLTEDGGASWNLKGELACDSVKGYTYLKEDEILILDATGKLYRCGL